MMIGCGGVTNKLTHFRLQKDIPGRVRKSNYSGFGRLNSIVKITFIKRNSLSVF